MNYKLDVPLSSELEKYRDRIEATIKPYIEIEINDNYQVSWWQSKFGGLPYLPKGFEYPKSPNGDYLFLLAQINFSEVPHLEGFPTEGILQFYIPGYIEEFFQVLYFPKPDFNEKHIITNYDFLPETVYFLFKGCCSVKFTKKYKPISHSDYRFKKVLGKEFCDLFTVGSEFWLDYIEISSAGGHKIGGYHYSAQLFDPRPEAYEAESEQEPYILLFQMDSDLNSVLNIMWGDRGQGNFFIQESALRKLDFSNVIYYWDCA